uniref:Uncharacterized protein n=1 Tax=Rhizophora mucronata TaxID=61149 RepID=A0A2P2NMR1_RHIMU
MLDTTQTLLTVGAARGGHINRDEVKIPDVMVFWPTIFTYYIQAT